METPRTLSRGGWGVGWWFLCGGGVVWVWKKTGFNVVGDRRKMQKKDRAKETLLSGVRGEKAMKRKIRCGSQKKGS